jgi:lysophospholipase L1-like esterase
VEADVEADRMQAQGLRFVRHWLLALVVIFGTGDTSGAAAQDADAELAAVRAELARVRTRLDDWPELRRYASVNATLPPAAPDEARVVFLGDSITDLWDEPRFGGFFPGKPYVNRGIGGQTTPQMLLRMRSDVVALAPRVVVILAGTNDIAGNTGPMTLEQIQDNLATMSELATLHGIKVVLSSVLPVSGYHYHERYDVRGPQTVRRPIELVTALNGWIKAYARSRGHVYLDYFSAMTDAFGMLKADFSEDDLHPNSAGYAVMAPRVEAAIAQALGGSTKNEGRSTK